MLSYYQISMDTFITKTLAPEEFFITSSHKIWIVKELVKIYSLLFKLYSMISWNQNLSVEYLTTPDFVSKTKIKYLFLILCFFSMMQCNAPFSALAHFISKSEKYSYTNFTFRFVVRTFLGGKHRIWISSAQRWHKMQYSG